MGKVPKYAQIGRKDILRKEDIALSLLNMICSEITQYAILYAEKIILILFIILAHLQKMIL